MKSIISSFFAAILFVLLHSSANAFCGFYVAKADATLFNNRSEVILVRDGIHTVITMSNDFKGDVKDFAMVVPVPVVLKESDIKVVNRSVFEYLDNYSAPRLVEYYDTNPCQRYIDVVTCGASTSKFLSSEFFNSSSTEEKDFGVTIEARYEVGEYDILILSATESTGLKTWLTTNGYKIPETAEQILQPYIKSNMKFFVVKVNLDRMKTKGKFDFLSPLQISFDHQKFMLPIRLGMANSQGTQDMIVYAFTKTGRVECTNYRTTKMPTDRKVPLFIKDQFGDFYKKTFDKTWRNEGRNAVFLEYAWNVTPSWNMAHCDPCVGPPPMQQEFADAGVNWSVNGENIFFTRLHVRYSRDRFPADLTFQETPNTESYQARYVLTHPASGEFDCEDGQAYLLDLQNRRKLETDELLALTGVYNPKNSSYLNEFSKLIKPTKSSPTKNDFDVVAWLSNPDQHALRVLLGTLFSIALALVFYRKLSLRLH
jgi:hypothetical protein